MAFDPRTREQIYESLEDGLRSRIPKLTNFAENSFNYVWGQAFSQQLHEQEVAASAVQLSGWPDYVGKQITEDDLDELGIRGAEPEDINEYVSPEHLDEFAKAFGVSRDTGTRGTGELAITTNGAATIPEDTEFGTQPDGRGNYNSYFTVSEETIDEAGTVTVEVIASTVGTEYNVGANTITFMPNPPNRVESVTNPEPITGGMGVQTNADLRKDIKNAVVESTEGGTRSGVEGFVAQETEATDVFVDEKPKGTDERSYPHGIVIALGGTDEEVKAAIDISRPSAVEHILERPTVFSVNVKSVVNGTDVDTDHVEERILLHFDELLLGDDVFRDKLIQIIMNSSNDIDNIESLIIEVDNEGHEYDSTLENHPRYQLDKSSFIHRDEGVTEIVGTVDGETQYEFVEGTDFIEDDGYIEWLVNDDTATLPDENTVFFVTYVVDNDLPIAETEVAQINNTEVTEE